MKKIIVGLALGLAGFVSAQTTAQPNTPFANKELRINFNDKGDYIKFTFLNQVWMRYTHNNPGSTLYDTPKDQTFDIGLRRTRMQIFGQLSKRVFFYTQIGQNNLSFNGVRKQGIFFHDALAELSIFNKYLSLGSGLTGWNGLSRFAAPAVGSILMVDAPLYQQSTNDVSDQFLRKFSVYAKGKIGKIDYRLVVSKPMSLQKASTAGGNFGTISSFSTLPPKLQYHGYVSYQFLDEEANTIPYATGSYLGKKRVFNIGAGFLYQKDAMWHLADNATDTVSTALKLFNVDVFYDAPLNKEKMNAITFYASGQYSDYGKGYYRNIGPMNPMTGTNTAGTLSGAGNAWPTLGTGITVFTQAGYLFKKDLLGKDNGTLQPYVGYQMNKFDYFDKAGSTFNVGVNWLIDGHRSKLTLDYQNRPVFSANSASQKVTTDRRGMVVLQYQISL